MTINLSVDDVFPDVELLDHRHRRRRFGSFTKASEFDSRVGFNDGYPLIVVFYRGFFCPRDQQQMRQLVVFQDELAVNYCRLVTIAVQPPMIQAAFSAGLGAKWTFLCDTERELIRQLHILDETEGEYADTAQPYTFVLRPDLRVYKIYDGWYFVGRPTLEELRQDLRAVMQEQSYYPYEAWNTEQVKALRIPQKVWADGVPPLGTSGFEVARGIVTHFDVSSGNGTIQIEGGEETLFFNFTAIPGEGYRTIAPNTPVRFEIVEIASGRAVRNVQAVL